MTNTQEKKCVICGHVPASCSALLDDLLCDSCNEWGRANLPVSTTHVPRTTPSEQYAAYVESFPLNDPRD